MSTLSEEISRRRTFAIISHPDAGSWTEPSMFDKYIALEDSGDETAYPYVGPQYTNALHRRAPG